MRALFEGPALGGTTVALFGIFLAIACLLDLRTRRIPNWLVIIMAVVGIGLAIMSQGTVHGGARALAGLLSGLLLWLPFWLLGMMGGGDVKLFAAGAAWIGPSAALEGAILAALCGGVLSLVYLLLQHGFGFTFMRLAHGLQQPSALRQTATSKWDRRMPYGLAMASGLLLAACRPGLLF